MGEHLIDGEFQSDKYPETPRGCVPLKTSDPMAQDLLWEYAQRRREMDANFSGGLEEALRLKGFAPSPELVAAIEARVVLLDALEHSLDTQNVYARALNRTDGKGRPEFESPQQWIDHLRETGDLCG